MLEGDSPLLMLLRIEDDDNMDTLDFRLPLVSPEDESLRAGLEFLRENNPILKGRGLESRSNGCWPRTVLWSRLHCGVNPTRWARNRKARCKPPELECYIAGATQRDNA